MRTMRADLAIDIWLLVKDWSNKSVNPLNGLRPRYFRGTGDLFHEFAGDYIY